MNRLGTTLALALGAVLLGGCSGATTSPAGPAAALDAYSTALNEGRAADAYLLLSDEAKREISLEAFRRMVEERPEDVRELARSLARPGNTPVVTATVVAPGGDQLELVYEDGRWVVDGTGIDRYGQATPRQAIVGFIRAFERQRFDVLMRYVPEAERQGKPEAMWGESGDAEKAPLTPEKLEASWAGEQKPYITGLIDAVKSALPTAKIEETEDRAAMPYGANGTVLFVREDGRWKIEDLQ